MLVMRQLSGLGERVSRGRKRGFTIPVNRWLVGRWQGNGHGQYSTIDSFQYGQEIVVQQDGRPFLHYESRAWILDEESKPVRPAMREVGWLRPVLEDGRATDEVELQAGHKVLIWGAAVTVVIASLLWAGGLEAIQTAMIIGALPFSVIMAPFEPRRVGGVPSYG